MYTASLENEERFEKTIRNSELQQINAQRELERIERAIATVEGYLISNLTTNKLQNHDEVYLYLLQCEQKQLVQSKKFRSEWTTMVITKGIKAEIACYHYFEKLQSKLGRSFESTLRVLRMDLLTQLTLS